MPSETKLDDSQRERLVYTYTYTSDGENGENPQTNTVKVTTTVEEETTPDGVKVLRKKEESQQVSKVTKIEKFTRIHRHLIDPLTGEIITEDHPKYQTLIEQSQMKHEISGGFLPNTNYSETKSLTNGMKHVTINDYNEPENNKSNTDERSMGYDPNDPNLVDEPDLDVENPYEGLGPGRPDPVSRVLMPTAGRHSPDSIGHAPPGYTEDYGTFSRMYAPFGLNEDDYSSKRRSPSIDTEFREQRWRDPDLEEVIEYLTHTSDVIKENAAAYLQHLCYNDDNIKSKTRSLNGINYLVNLLNHDKVEIQKNACGALRNLCYGKRNDENKIELKKCNGIPALIHLLRRTPYEDVRESVTAVLWNASSSPHLKGQILDEGLIVLVKNIIIPFSGWDADIARRLNPQGKFPPVFKNTTGILRNCSSADYEGRRKMRECEGFIPSLLHAVNSSLQSLNEIDNKSIENCMCILRNLSYKLQEVVDRDYDRNYPGTSTWNVTASSQNNDKNKTGCMSTKQKKSKQIYEQTGHNNNNNNHPIYAVIPPRQGRPVEMLWQPEVIGTYVHLLRHSSNPDTLEATAGCIQNLTACYWKPSIDLRGEVRKARGLVELVDLLRVDECDSVVNASAIALRNLAIDPKNCDVLGGWAIKELVAILPDSSEQTSTRRRHSDETLASVLAALNELVRSHEINAKILFQEGGVAKMKAILNIKGNVYNSKVMKYTAHVLNTMSKHKSLHDFYKQNGYKENDFLQHRAYNSKSLTSSPQSTLHRPRGDMGQPTHFTTKGKQITRPQRSEEYRMQKMNQSIDNLSRTYGNNGTLSSHYDPHADLYATVHKTRTHQAQASPDSWV